MNIAQLKIFEGCIPWMYLDTVDLVTVGVGNMIPNAAMACTLPFKNAAGELAAPDAITNDFARVAAMPQGKVPNFYRYDGSLTLDDDVIDSLLEKRIAGFEGDLQAIFADYAAYPQSVQDALVDMIFNLGKSGFLRYLIMIDSVRRKDWKSAALQCARNSHDPAFNERNAWCKQQFLAAAGE